MSNNTTEMLIRVIEELQNDVTKARQGITELETQLANQTYRADSFEKHIAKLNEVIDYLEREKWSFQSELENLRGW